MALYLVLDANDAERVVALLDRQGRYHVAQVDHEVPAIGTVLAGTGALAGRCAMVATASREVYRMTFEQCDCTQEETFDRLHTRPVAPPDRRQTVASAGRFVARRTTDTWDGVVPAGRT